MTPLSRRSFLAAGAGAVLLAACGSSGSGSAGTNDQQGSTSGGDVATPGLKVIQFFPDGTQAAGTRQRFPFGLGDANGPLEGSGGPKELVAKVVNDQGVTVVDGLVVPRHDVELKRPYWPLITDKLPTGIYDVSFTADGVALPAATISVSPPEVVAVKKPGDRMPAIVTPTMAAPAGVDPVCTAQPPCPLHDVTLADALKGPLPVVFLVGTPAYCQTGICGPVLDVLLNARKAYEDKITFLHAEVYTDSTLKAETDAVTAMGLTFEPSLFFARDGVIVDRLDVIYDRSELDPALAALVA